MPLILLYYLSLWYLFAVLHAVCCLWYYILNFLSLWYLYAVLLCCIWNSCIICIYIICIVYLTICIIWQDLYEVFNTFVSPVQFVLYTHISITLNNSYCTCAMPSMGLYRPIITKAYFCSCYNRPTRDRPTRGAWNSRHMGLLRPKWSQQSILTVFFVQDINLFLYACCRDCMRAFQKKKKRSHYKTPCP